MLGSERAGQGRQVRQALIAIASISASFTLPLPPLPFRPVITERQKFKPDQFADFSRNLDQPAMDVMGHSRPDMTRLYQHPNLKSRSGRHINKRNQLVQ